MPSQTFIPDVGGLAGNLCVGSDRAQTTAQPPPTPLTLVGETGLEPATRSTQSYGATEDKLGPRKDLREPAEAASQVLPKEGPGNESATAVERALLAAIRALGPEAARRVARALDEDRTTSAGGDPS